MFRDHLSKLCQLAKDVHQETGKAAQFTVTVDPELYERMAAEAGHAAIDRSSDGTPVAMVYPRSFAVGAYVVVRPRDDNRITRPIGG